MTFFILIIFPFALGAWAQMHVKNTYNKHLRVRAKSGITGAEAASAIMQASGITGVEITRTPGQLTDHYDPTHKRLALSEENYHGTSLAALGVAAHEAGHAIQHHVGYKPLHARAALVPVTNIASSVLPIVMLGGFFLMHSPMLLYVGLFAYLVLTVFQLVTLPVEFDASRRAKRQLIDMQLVAADELPGVTKTLDAAAWTYVAAFVSSLGWLLYFFLRTRN